MLSWILSDIDRWIFNRVVFYILVLIFFNFLFASVM